LSFSPDLTSAHTLVDDNIDNVLTAVDTKTYSFKDRYDKSVDGVGYCTPDTTAPVVQFINPVSYASSVPASSHVIFTVSDDRSGVDMNSLNFTVDGAQYNSSSSQVNVTSDGKLFRVDLTPKDPFKPGASVAVKVHACDKSSSPNCFDASNTFQVFTTTTLPAVCGDGVMEPGEQCDHGSQNGVSGDTCSSLCLNVNQSISHVVSASCFDGIQNGSETAVDCGGPCKSCPTCVDGIQNQGEEGVDCGGPCPACGDKAKVVCETPTANPSANQAGISSGDTSIICHTPDNDPKHPYTMMIFKSSWPDYQTKGDTLGPCSTDQMCSALKPVAPEIEKKASQDATAVVAVQQPQEKPKIQVEAPTTQAKIIDRIAVCKSIPEYAKCNFDNPSVDTDGDGLSDRTECYIGTSCVNPDTDGDGCSDGDEINRFNTNPLDPTDCKLAVKTDQGFNQVLITDPKPAWTLGSLTPRFSGLVPLKTTAVTVTVFHADQKTVKALSAAVNAVNQASDLDAAKKAISGLQTAVADARKFVDLNGTDFNYADLQTAVSKIETQVSLLDKSYSNATSFVSKDYFDTLKKLGFGDLGLEIGGLLRDPVIIGSTNQLSQSLLNDQQIGSFELLPTTPLEDQKLYDVIATATLASKTVSSTPIQFGINTGFTVSKPIPRTLGGKLIPGGKISFGGVLIDLAYAQDNTSQQPQIEIDQARPVITGDTEFGSQVFAIWNSVVLSSSVISDSEQGAFEIQAPKDLETNIAHRVTLYAVKTDKNKTLRSESVDIYFHVKSKERNLVPIVIGVLCLLLLIAAASYLIRRMRETRTVIRYLKGSSRKRDDGKN
jgi:cysteine-rich repeat protein